MFDWIDAPSRLDEMDWRTVSSKAADSHLIGIDLVRLRLFSQAGMAGREVGGSAELRLDLS